MLKKLLLLFLFTNMLMSNEDIYTYQNAVHLENQGNYKKANDIYKKIINDKKKQNIYILDLSKDKDKEVITFAQMKKNFYKTRINKGLDEETNENLEQMITGSFDLYPYKKNYLLPITYDTQERDDREQFETSFQFSIEKPVSYNFFGFNEAVSFAYTQKSFWQTSADSSPFREINYLPEVFIQFPYEKSHYFKGYKLSLIHHSNGRKNENSRSWNRVYLEGYYQLTNIFVIPKVWYRFPEKTDDDNPDIHHYYGYGDMTIMYPYKKHNFELLLRNNLKFNSNNKSTAQLNWTFPLPSAVSNSNSYGFLQIFSGYGESLIDYDKKMNKIGFGIALSR